MVCITFLLYHTISYYVYGLGFGPYTIRKGNCLKDPRLTFIKEHRSTRLYSAIFEFNTNILLRRRDTGPCPKCQNTFYGTTSDCLWKGSLTYEALISGGIPRVVFALS